MRHAWNKAALFGSALQYTPQDISPEYCTASPGPPNRKDRRERGWIATVPELQTPFGEKFLG